MTARRLNQGTEISPEIFNNAVENKHVCLYMWTTFLSARVIFVAAEERKPVGEGERVRPPTV